ncbi:unnamed protein product [Phytomonas sp. Hart1]|nr:unnamed protein product [Phytomonas sp. Hart1]|eukprot:CCW70017.1 unnamed protein product [Phytomonas sp. isolate Hart1]
MQGPVAGRRSGKTPVPAAFGLDQSSGAQVKPTGTFESDVFGLDDVPEFPIPADNPVRRGGPTRSISESTALVDGLARSSHQPEGAIPSFLLHTDDLNDTSRGIEAGLWGATAGPAHGVSTGPSSHAVTSREPRKSNLPGFLNDFSADDSGRPMAELSRNVNFGEDDAVRQASLRKQRQDLQTELKEVNEALRASQANMDSINNGTHHLCLEVDALGKEKQSLLQKQDSLSKNRSEVEANTQAVQDKLNQERAIEVQASLDEFSKQQHHAYHEELTCLQKEFSEHEERLQRTRHNLDEMKTHLLSSPHETAIQQLEGALQHVMDGVKSEFACCLKPLLRECIASNITSANQQRREIFRKDRDDREGALRIYRDRQAHRFREFHDGYRAQLRRHRDTAFAELRQQWENDQTTRGLESQRRLAAHRVEIEAQTQRVRQVAEENIMMLRGQGQRSVDALQETYRAKEAQLEKSLERDLRNFLERAEAEKHSMISGRQLIRSSSENVHFIANRSVNSDLASSAFDELKSFLDRIRSQVDQIRFSALTEVHMLKVSSTERRSRDLVGLNGWDKSLDSDATCAFEQQLNHHQNKVRPLLMKVHSTIASMQHALNSFHSTLQAKQLQLGTLHNEVVSTRRAWDEDIEGHLSGFFLSGGNRDREQSDLPFAEDLVREVLLDLQAKLEGFMERQGQLKYARQEHVEKLAAQLTQVQEQKNDNSAALCSVFELYDKLSQTSGTVEVRRRLMEVSKTDLKKARQQLEKGHLELSKKFKQLEGFAHRLHKQSKMLQAIGQGAGLHPKCLARKSPIDLKRPLLTCSGSQHTNLPPKSTFSGPFENREENTCSISSMDLFTPLCIHKMPSS